QPGKDDARSPRKNTRAPEQLAVAFLGADRHNQRRVQPAEVDFKFTQDAFQAAAAFNADKRLAGAVSWSPDIYNLEKVKGNRILVTTSTANKLIADVWFARADFAKDNPDVMEGIARGIFDAMEELKAQPAKQKVAKLMAAG